MVLGGIAVVAENFFKMAGISDSSIQEDIDRINKYQFDTHTEVELNNGTIIRAEANIKMSEDLNSKSKNIFENKKNSLLETLLKTI